MGRKVVMPVRTLVPFKMGPLNVGTVLVAFALLSLQAASATEIHFRPTARFSPPAVTLKDVAIITGCDEQRLAMLQQIVLGPAPAPGRKLRLDFDTMRG